ncbi:hypothetical protein D5086_007663 [Populus alba]|uniref:Uncharacterized protein n=1 Tax=Populus alba TaxID=43335 RepID=A0ACC4CQ93_POPAL
MENRFKADDLAYQGVSISRVFMAEKKRHYKHTVKVGNPATDHTHPSRLPVVFGYLVEVVLSVNVDPVVFLLLLQIFVVSGLELPIKVPSVALMMFDLNEVPKRVPPDSPLAPQCAVGLMPMKKVDDRGTTDAYCVAKYGQKWIRTRTIVDSFNPRWNEQYTWESSGVRKTGEVQLAVRFTCSSLVNMLHMYSHPLLPKMHYVHPLSVMQLDSLRHQAMQIVSMRLSRSEPPLRKEVVEYMLDVDSHMWSMRRSKANFFRIMAVLSGLIAVGKWFDQICNWKNSLTTILIHILFIILVLYPELILPTIFLYLFLIGLWNYRRRPRHPPHMDTRLSHADAAHPDELDEEFDSFPTSRPSDIVRMRYDRLRSIAGRVQTVVGDLATQGERFQSLISWRDPRATTLFVTFCLIAAIVLYVTPFQVLALLIGLYVLRHPRFRHKLPSVPLNFFRRLPARSDSML